MMIDDIVDKIDIASLSSEQKELVEILGKDAYLSLISVYGGTSMYLPTAETLIKQHRDAEVRKRYTGGESARDLALEFKVSLRTIRRIIAEDRS